MGNEIEKYFYSLHLFDIYDIEKKTHLQFSSQFLNFIYKKVNVTNANVHYFLSFFVQVPPSHRKRSTKSSTKTSMLSLKKKISVIIL